MSVLGIVFAYLLDPFLWLGGYLGAKIAPRDSRKKKFIYAFLAVILMSVIVVMTLGNGFRGERVVGALIIAAICSALVNRRKTQDKVTSS